MESQEPPQLQEILSTLNRSVRMLTNVLGNQHSQASVSSGQLAAIPTRSGADPVALQPVLGTFSPHARTSVMSHPFQSSPVATTVASPLSSLRSPSTSSTGSRASVSSVQQAAIPTRSGADPVAVQPVLGTFSPYARTSVMSHPFQSSPVATTVASPSSLISPSTSSTGSRASQLFRNIGTSHTEAPIASHTSGSSEGSTSRFRGTGFSSALKALNSPRNRVSTPSFRGVEKFEREVVLLRSSKRDTVLSNKEKSDCGRLWRKGLEFSKSMTEADVCQTIYDEYDALLFGLNFSILMPVGKFLRQPPLSKGKRLDGKAIFLIFKQKPIYLRPSEDLWEDENDMEYYVPEEKKSRLSEDENTSSVPEAEPNTVILDDDLPDSSDNEVEEVTVESLPIVLPQPLVEQPDGDNDVVNVPLFREPDPAPFFPVFAPKNAADLQRLLAPIRDALEGTNERPFRVSRSDPFHTAVNAMKRPRFKINAGIYVKFFEDMGSVEMEEDALDLSGPTREFFSILLQWLRSSSLFEGPVEEKTLSLNHQALESNLYYYAGTLIGMSIIHGGPSPSFFSKDLIHLLLNKEDEISSSPDHIDNNYFTFTIEQIRNSSGEREDLTTLITGSLAEVAGAIPMIDFATKDKVIEGLSKYFKTSRVAAPLEQFTRGLEEVGLLPLIRRETLFVESMFLKSSTPTAEQVLDLFQATRSPPGSNRHAIETKVLAFWSCYLEDCEDGITGVTISQILQFSLGISTVPPMGFAFRPSLKFLHGSNKVFLEAHTCNLELDLPVCHLNYECFQKAVTRGLQEPLKFTLL